MVCITMDLTVWIQTLNIDPIKDFNFLKYIYTKPICDVYNLEKYFKTESHDAKISPKMFLPCNMNRCPTPKFEDNKTKIEWSYTFFNGQKINNFLYNFEALL